jgi:hypothetical protein
MSATGNSVTRFSGFRATAGFAIKQPEPWYGRSDRVRDVARRPMGIMPLGHLSVWCPRSVAMNLQRRWRHYQLAGVREDIERTAGRILAAAQGCGVLGVSLGLRPGAAAAMRFRRRKPGGFARASALYHLTGGTLDHWDHSIAATDVTRWPITFRSLSL